MACRSWLSLPTVPSAPMTIGSTCTFHPRYLLPMSVARSWYLAFFSLSLSNMSGSQHTATSMIQISFFSIRKSTKSGRLSWTISAVGTGVSTHIFVLSHSNTEGLLTAIGTCRPRAFPIRWARQLNTLSCRCLMPFHNRIGQLDRMCPIDSGITCTWGLHHDARLHV